MKYHFPAVATILFASLSLTTAAAAARVEALSEAAKIERLLTHVRDMKDAEFIRNGKAYDGKAAAEHIQKKYENAKDQVKTARDFIAKCASKSEASGDAYKIRFKDGKEQTASEYLTAQLDQIEKAAKSHA